MAIFSTGQVTNLGKKLLVETITDQSVTFTRMIFSSNSYEEEQLETLENLTGNQEARISNVQVKEDNICLEARISNEDVLTGYYIRTVGVFARNVNDNEILFAVCVEKSGNCFMESKDIGVSGAFMQMYFAVSNKEKISLEVTPAGCASILDLKQLEMGIQPLKIHVDDSEIHVTQSEKENWNNKAAVDGDITNTRVVTFTKTGTEYPLPEENQTLGNLMGNIHGCLSVARTLIRNLMDVELPALKKSVSDGKEKLATAITLKRVATASTDTFTKMAENIGKIVLGSGNAQPGDVLSGKTFTNSEGVELTGIIPNNGVEFINQNHAMGLDMEGSANLWHYIPRGFYEKINDNGSLVRLPINRVRDAIGLSGRQNKILNDTSIAGVQGTIPISGGQTINPTNYQQVVSCNGKYMTGDVVVPAVSNLVPQHIKAGVQVGNVVGTFPDYSYLAAGQVVFRNGIFSGLMAEGMQSPNRPSYVYHPQIVNGSIDMGIRNGNGWRGGRYFISKKTIHLGAFNRLVVRYSSAMSNAYDIEYEVRIYPQNYTWRQSANEYADFVTLVSNTMRTRQEQHNVAIEVDISGINEQCFIAIMTRDTYSGGRRIAAKINEIELIN